MAQFVEFETKIQRIIAELDKSHPLGWIVDIRGNVGGNMVGPMLHWSRFPAAEAKVTTSANSSTPMVDVSGYTVTA